MCGITAVFSPQSSLDPADIEALARRTLNHRGPDGVGAATLGRAAAAHTRLAIIDVAGGQQPMHAEERDSLMVCNGEIYNHRLLRERLNGAHHMATKSDSEVVLHLHQDLGPGCVPELDGMFAFFVSDGRGFTAARDAIGIKPLYYGRTESGETWFASELKALAGRCETISTLPPGHLITDQGRVERWFSPSWEKRVGERREVSSEELLARLDKSVQKRLMSDVPMGVFLSGGLDSSLIAALARPHLSPARSFAVGLPGAPDLEYARMAARALHTEHHERSYSIEEVARELSRIIYHLESYDAPLVRSAIACFFLSELAAQHVKVVLTGEGADEVFGGYAYFRGIKNPTALHHECSRLLDGLHGMNLQRVDRMTMAHGLEGRVPFLDVEFIEWTMGIAPDLKLQRPGVPEKNLLRAAASRVLPAEIAWRTKLEFADGAGATDLLAGYAESRVSDRDLMRAERVFPRDPPRTKEELLYRRIFAEHFPGEAAQSTVHRWQPVPSFKRPTTNGAMHDTR